MDAATKQDIENLTTAVVEGLQAMHERFEEIDETLTQHGQLIDHIAGRVDDLWVEAGAQTQANRRFEARIERLEQQLGLSPITEDMIAA